MLNTPAFKCMNSREITTKFKVACFMEQKSMTVDLRATVSLYLDNNCLT